MTNPFTPTFGVIPAHMAGREHIISELIRALEAGPGDPGPHDHPDGRSRHGKDRTPLVSGR